MLTLLPVRNVNFKCTLHVLVPFCNVFTLVSHSSPFSVLTHLNVHHSDNTCSNMNMSISFIYLFIFYSLCYISVVLLCSPLKCVNHVDFRKQAGISGSNSTTKSFVLLVRCQIYTVAQLHVHLQDNDHRMKAFVQQTQGLLLLMITMF